MAMFMNTCPMVTELRDPLGRIHSISGLGPNGHNQWGPTVKESGIRNLDGPAAATFYEKFDEETQQSLVNRDLSNVKHLVEDIRATD